MFEITVEREFCAAHAIMIRGQREPLHGHNWHVKATIAGGTLDADGLLLDFHALEQWMDEIVKPLNSINLNEVPPFTSLNPTAENVALHIADSVAAKLPSSLMLSSVSVTEAPGCVATVRKGHPMSTPAQQSKLAAEASAASSATPVSAPLTPPGDTTRFLNRELQWLEFNDRVLYQATDDRVPLLERVKFLAIFSGNLDEFFMKRVGGLRRQVDAGVSVFPEDAMTTSQQLEAIRQRVIPMTQKLADCYRKQIVPSLKQAGIELLSYKELSDAEKKESEEWYRRHVFPILTPLAVDPGHRFPFISNLSESLGVMLRKPGESEQLFARVKIPEIAARWYCFSGTKRYVQLQDIIEHNLDDLFPGMEITRVLPFRVTRNADVERDSEDAEDLLEHIQKQLRERRFARVVRLEVGRKPNPRILRFLMEEMELSPADVYETEGLIDYESLFRIADLDLPEHHFAPWRPVIPPQLADEEKDIFSVIRAGDVLVHHPYESFDASVERFVEEAAGDPKVLCIKQALYRTSGDSSFIPELIRAAETNKQVAVLVELRARFDEARNILWARKLEDAGVHVAYGVMGLKTHTKIALVVRQEGNGIRCYGHIGTGNYNAKTARLYEDVGLFTCDPAITEDLISVFNYMTGRSRQRDFNKLLVAPITMKKRIIEMIEREVLQHSPDNPGHIIAKMNQLEDRAVTDALYRASQAGVKIDLIVRGFCCLRPGVPGLSDNIRVYSIIGRFLEHSRIFYFKNGRADPIEGDFSIGSADWMYRNLNTRVEIVAPIEDRAARRRLWQILQWCLTDVRQCWDMQPDGSYIQRNSGSFPPEAPETIGVHQRLMTAARESVERRRVEEQA